MTVPKTYMRKFVEQKEEKKDLSDQEISRYKDFGLLKTNYQKTLDQIHKKPLYKSKWGFLIILLILLVLFLLLNEN